MSPTRCRRQRCCPRWQMAVKALVMELELELELVLVLELELVLVLVLELVLELMFCDFCGCHGSIQ